MNKENRGNLKEKEHYFRLLDKEHYNTIVKVDSVTRYEYVPVKGWVESALFWHYIEESSDLYEKFEEITAQEAIDKYGVKPEHIMKVVQYE